MNEQNFTRKLEQFVTELNNHVHKDELLRIMTVTCVVLTYCYFKKSKERFNQWRRPGVKAGRALEN